MTQQLKLAIVRIWNTNDKIVGAGVLVGSRQIITCAHVVRESLNLPDTPEQCPEEHVTLDFPFLAPKKILSAQVKIWNPRKEDGSGDIAGLELNVPPPLMSSPIKLINKAEVSELSSHKCRSFGFPEYYDAGVWSFDNVIQDERPDGTVQLTNWHGTGHRIQKGFSGGAIWDDELNGVVGIATKVDNQVNLKVAFMLPTKKIIEVWPELSTQTKSNSRTTEIPFLVLAMTRSQAQELLDGDIFNHPEVPSIVGNNFARHRSLLEHNGIVDIRELYGDAPEDWKPYEYSGLSVEHVIWQMLNHHNEDHRLSDDPVLLPKFVTKDFWLNNKSYINAKKLFERRGGVIIIDAISLHHPKINKILSNSDLLTKEKVAVLILSPVNKTMLTNNSLIEKVIRLNMGYVFERFEHQCDLSCEIGIGDIRIFKRWFINVLHGISMGRHMISESSKTQMEIMVPYETQGMNPNGKF